MNLVAVVAAPPAVRTVILLLPMPLGTVARSWVGESTVNAALALPNVTWVALTKPVPVMVTTVPAGRSQV